MIDLRINKYKMKRVFCKTCMRRTLFYGHFLRNLRKNQQNKNQNKKHAYIICETDIFMIYWIVVSKQWNIYTKGEARNENVIN